ncbi:MAG: TonB-dependent receptor, partial [Pseudomonadota bacterium]|nr:TonB-dependent receptor [Pseudomonadota bacterium]HAM20371.1 TonB-dependent receptor [Alteromonas macleodii]
MRPLYPRTVYPRSLLATTIAFALSSAAIAQEVAPDTENEHNYIEEITVTAQMREQSVMDVPVTMDVIGSEFLERTNIMELDELSRILPNVQIQEQA